MGRFGWFTVFVRIDYGLCPLGVLGMVHRGLDRQFDERNFLCVITWRICDSKLPHGFSLTLCFSNASEPFKQLTSQCCVLVMCALYFVPCIPANRA